jgi:membrane protein implicated in regulation of membrane protease activity
MAERKKKQANRDSYGSKGKMKTSDALIIILIVATFILIGYVLVYLPALTSPIDIIGLLKIIMLAIGALITYLWRRRIKNTLDQTQNLIKDWRKDLNIRDKELRKREGELSERMRELSEERDKTDAHEDDAEMRKS